jgi:RNA-directed DNA polymerase
MINTPISLQDLRRGLYVKGEGRTSLAFLGTIRSCLQDGNLYEAYQMGKSNDGAPGSDGVTFEAIEESGVESF